MDNVKEHFDAIAADYDFWKKRNSYYYDNVKKLYRELVPENKNVLDLGCGTGEVLDAVKPSFGVGCDLSSGMIVLARQKFADRKDLYFTSDLDDVVFGKTKFDYIMLSDVIEHLDNVEETMAHLAKISGSGTKVIISMANPSWEPILLMLEKLRMKMPEGPHTRISFRKLKSIAVAVGFRAEQEGTRLLIPTHIPLADAINKSFFKYRAFRGMGLIGFIVLIKR